MTTTTINNTNATVNTNNTQEVVGMNNTVEVVEASNYMNSIKAKIERVGTDFFSNCASANTALKDMAKMTPEELEIYLKDNADKLWSNIKAWFNDEVKEARELADMGIINEEDVVESQEQADVINGIEEEAEKNGCVKVGVMNQIKYHAIKILVRGAQIALRVAVTVVIGVIKIVVAVVNSAINVGTVVYTEAVAPAINRGKAIAEKAKARRAEKAKAEKEAEEQVDSVVEEVIIEELYDQMDDAMMKEDWATVAVLAKKMESVNK